MSLTHVKIENYKSIKNCEMNINNITTLVGQNGTGKSNILNAINYFYNNLINNNINNNIFDDENKYSNQVKISLTFDLSDFVNLQDTNKYVDQKTPFIKHLKELILLSKDNQNHHITVQLSQTKYRSIKWNIKYKYRFIIKSIFPLFYINTRDLDIKRWSMLWETIGELSNVSNEKRNDFKLEYDNLFTKNKAFNTQIQKIQELFNDAKINILPNTTKDFTISAVKLFFSGNSFSYNNKNLNYYSTGTASVKYLDLILQIINEFSLDKSRKPIILLDEPEISLHPNNIDNFASTLLSIDQNSHLILSTHSPRLVKRILTQKNNLIYSINKKDCYTITKKMNNYSQYNPLLNNIVLDDYINSYFAKAILFVEGETELELFSNSYLHVLFPFLNSLNIHKAMSNNKVLEIMNPNITKSNIPFLCLIDADKVIQFIENKNQFKLLKQYTNYEKELFFYRNKKSDFPYLPHQKKRIDAMAKKIQIKYNNTLYSCNDINFVIFTNNIHEYLLKHNVFMLKTTIEGAIINNKSLPIVLNFIKNSKDEQIIKDLFAKYATNTNDQTNILRIYFNGKNDLLINKTPINKKYGDKTSGWITKFIEYFFNTYLHPISNAVNKDDKNNMLNLFANYFPELYKLFQNLNNLCY